MLCFNKKNKFVLINLIITCGCNVLHAQLFHQDFNPATKVAGFVSSSPGNTQFDLINATAASNIAVDTTQGKLVYERNLTGGSGTGVFVRTTDLGTPATLMFSFDLEVEGAANDEIELDFRIGDGFPGSSNAMSAGQTFVRIPINLTAGNGVQMRLLNPATGALQSAGNNSPTFPGMQRVHVVCNASGSSIQYVSPGGTYTTLDHNRFDIWIGITQIASGIRAVTEGVLLREFKMIWSGGVNSTAGKVIFDNFRINPVHELIGNYYISNNGTGDVLSLSNDNGLFEMINNAGYTITGNCNFMIRSDLTAETGTHALNEKAGMNLHRLIIMPDSALQRTISGTVNTDNKALIALNGADNVHIDGRDPGNPLPMQRLLKIVNTSDGVHSPTIRYMNDAGHNVLRNAWLEGACTGDFGVVCFNTGTLDGNDNDTVMYCDIKNVGDTPGAGNPRYGIVSRGSSATVCNEHIYIAHNRIYNIYNETNDVDFISLQDEGASNAWTIENNSFFLESNVNFSAQRTVNFIGLKGAPGNASTYFYIRNNFFGGRGEECSGAYAALINTTSTAIAMMRVRAIFAQHLSLTDTTYISGNIFSKIMAEVKRSPQNNGGNASLNFLASWGGNIKCENNTIGKTAGGEGGLVMHCNALSPGNAASGWMAAFYFEGTGTENLHRISLIHNSIDSIALSTSGTAVDGTPANDLSHAVGIYCRSNTPVNIENNSIQNIYTGNPAGKPVMAYGMLLEGTGDFTIKGNLISGIYGTAGFNTTQVAGICEKSGLGNLLIDSNRIENIFSSTSSVALGAVAGIYTASTADIRRNTIRQISATHTAAAPVALCAIVKTGAGQANIARNKISQLHNHSSGTLPAQPPMVVGIALSPLNAGDTLSNNMLSAGGDNDVCYAGIYLAQNGGNRVGMAAYNSVYLYGANPGSNHRSYGYLVGQQGAPAISDRMELVNNVFFNARSGGAGNYALGKPDASSAWGITYPACVNQALPDYNAYYALSATETAYWEGSSLSFSDYRSVAGSDLHSHDISSEFVAPASPFVDPASGDLHIDAGAATIPVNGRAMPIAAINYDFDGDFRRSPDIGADEIELKYTFTGTTTDWHTATNWHPKGIPDCGDTVVISAGGIVDINSGNAYCYQLENNGTLNVNNNAVLSGCWLNDGKNHFGRFVNNGIVHINAAGTIALNADMENYGTIAAGSAGTVSLNADNVAGRNCIFNEEFILPYNRLHDTSNIVSSAPLSLMHLHLKNNAQTILLGYQPLEVKGTLDLNGNTGTGWLQLNGNTLTLKGNITYSDAVGHTSTLYADSEATLIIDSTTGNAGVLNFHHHGSELKSLKINRMNELATLGTRPDGQVLHLKVNDSLTINAGELHLASATLSIGHTAGGYVSGMHLGGRIVGSANAKLHLLGNGDALGDVYFKTDGVNDNQLEELSINRPGGYATIKTTLKTDMLLLDNGLLENDGSEPLHVTGGAGAIVGGGAQAYVSGLLRRSVSVGTFDFPVGHRGAGAYMPVQVNMVQPGSNTALNVKFDTSAVLWGTGWPLAECGFNYMGPCLGGSWWVTPNASSAGVNYDITLSDPSGYLNCAGAANITVVKRSDATAPWELPGIPLACGGLQNTRTGIASFSQFVLAGDDIALPVRNLNLSAQVLPDRILLLWKAENEHNVDNYEVEKSTDGVLFEKIGRVTALNNAAVSNYSFVDWENTGGEMYYRVKQTDRDGSVAYSPVVKAVVQPISHVSVSSKPGGLQALLYLPNDTEANLWVVDVTGRTIFYKNVDLTYEKTMLVDIPLPAGGNVYVFKLTGNSGYTYVKKTVH